MPGYPYHDEFSALCCETDLTPAEQDTLVALLKRAIPCPHFVKPRYNAYLSWLAEIQLHLANYKAVIEQTPMAYREKAWLECRKNFELQIHQRGGISQFSEHHNLPRNPST